MNYQERLFRSRYGYECPMVLLAASLVISAASAVASVQGQKATAKAQESYQNQLTNANNAAAEQQAGALRDQQAQQREAQARDLFKADLANTRATSTARSMAAENGQQGSSVEALLAEYDMQHGMYQEAVMRQRHVIASIWWTENRVVHEVRGAHRLSARRGGGGRERTL